MAVANFVQEGDRIDYTPVGALAAGDVVDLGTFVGIALQPIAAGVQGVLAIRGTFDVNKYTGEAISLGATVYWDVGTTTATGTSGYSEATMGKCVKAAAAGDATVRVTLTPGSA